MHFFPKSERCTWTSPSATRHTTALQQARRSAPSLSPAKNIQACFRQCATGIVGTFWGLATGFFRGMNRSGRVQMPLVLWPTVHDFHRRQFHFREHCSRMQSVTQCRRRGSNPLGKCSPERLTRGTVTSTMRKAAHPPGCARCGAGAGRSSIKYQSLTQSKEVCPGKAVPSMRAQRHLLNADMCGYVDKLVTGF